MIPFNQPHLTGKELAYIEDVLSSRKLSGNGNYTKRCEAFFESKYNFGKCLLTTSCTDALEMAAILINIQPGDEVIVPSYTFPSTANAFILRGAKIVFVDSRPDHPGMDEEALEQLITSKTKAIVPVHYAGVACDMDIIMNLADKYSLFVIEDAAQAIDSYFTDRNGAKRALGSIGHLAAFSFHETKNITSGGEGGMLVINDAQFKKRAEIIWEKGTNRSAFLNGEVNKYGWVDVGSSFLPSEVAAAFLWAQVEYLDEIQKVRESHWDRYYQGLYNWANENEVALPVVPEYATNNAHTFYLVAKNNAEQVRLLSMLKANGIAAAFHHLSLHSSLYYSALHDNRILNRSDHYSNCLIRLPFFFDLKEEELRMVINKITVA